MQPGAPHRLLVAVTGASGMLYLRAFLKVIATGCLEVHGICSPSGRQVLQMEEDIEPAALPGVARWFAPDDFAAPPASGSSRYHGMVVLPCSMGTLAAIASGLSINLIHRAADVMLKERRPLVLAVRETPFNRTHLQNMLAAHDAGAVICPPMPAHYLRPATLEEAARTYAWRLADQLGIGIADRKRWGDDPLC
ncbi:MAG: UbiX family flavin prenyltransferase [Desulfoprunum sp.]|jgi:4-hydroxy-3-polyprenylbenzoate decarboxylase|uniref:UbiX family flavin prenyltransferase n=1 Tax=Desulfoprunum sp. TaxID=2020866 RepID=UPI00052B674C|nr:aromatic acid decarboxylase [Desulfobulbus sp. Tol-SR]